MNRTLKTMLRKHADNLVFSGTDTCQEYSGLTEMCLMIVQEKSHLWDGLAYSIRSSSLSPVPNRMRTTVEHYRDELITSLSSAQSLAVKTL